MGGKECSVFILDFWFFIFSALILLFMLMILTDYKPCFKIFCIENIININLIFFKG